MIQNQKKQNRSVRRPAYTSLGFTLVELIVVITILAILGTIAFISLQGYSRHTRNSVRISDLSNISKMIGVKIAETGKVPMPDDSIEITASGTTLIYQGEVGEKVLDILGVFNGGKDPLDETYYTYSINRNFNKYQVTGFLEGGDSLTFLSPSLTNALELTDREIITKGTGVGVILGATGSYINTPINLIDSISLGSELDILNYSGDNLNIIFSNEISIEGTGTTILSNIVTRDKTLLKDKTLALLDTNLLGYWDMNTTFNSGGIDYLQDFSSYGNHGSLNGNLFFENDIEYGNVIDFTGVGNYIRISDFTGEITDSLSFSVYAEPGEQFDNYATILRNGFPFNNGYSLRFRNGDPYLSFLIGGNDYTYQSYLYKEESVINKKYFYTCVYDGVNMKIYVNGVLFIEGTTPVEEISFSSNNLIIGGRERGITNPDIEDTFIGKIGEIRLYNRALSSDEVVSLYNYIKK